MTHSDLVRSILLKVSPLGLAWENRTGQGWSGKLVGKMPNGRVVLADARPIRFGLPGSTDILCTIKGRSVVIEAKTGTGRLQENQKDFAAAAVAAGALHIVARSVDDVTDALRLEGLA
jgi:hypothetical protein